jgi:Reverse transcriptase (RNA-dependent DNA polymerase)
MADGHLADIPLDSVYSGKVSLQGFQLVLFPAALNGLQLWATDIGTAYLEAYTSEKVYIVAGPEFGDREGHILLISKELYGLQSSGARWPDRFVDCIRELQLDIKPI